MAAVAHLPPPPDRIAVRFPYERNTVERFEMPAGRPWEPGGRARTAPTAPRAAARTAVCSLNEGWVSQQDRGGINYTAPGKTTHRPSWSSTANHQP